MSCPRSRALSNNRWSGGNEHGAWAMDTKKKKISSVLGSDLAVDKINRFWHPVSDYITVFIVYSSMADPGDHFEVTALGVRDNFNPSIWMAVRIDSRDDFTHQRLLNWLLHYHLIYEIWHIFTIQEKYVHIEATGFKQCMECMWLSSDHFHAFNSTQTWTAQI